MDKAAQPLTPYSLLYVEDDPFVSELYARALTTGGYKVTIEPDGQRGLELAQTNRYDIIILDLMTPTLSGIEVLRILRDPAKTPQLKSKIIIMTNLEQRESVRAEIEKQADAYFVKADITPKQFVEALNRINIPAKPLQ